MNEETLEAVCLEFRQELPGRRIGRIFPLTRRQIAIDLRLPASRYLFLSIEPNSPRTYLIRRKLKDLERQSTNLTPFLLLLKARISGSEILSVEKLPSDRILIIDLVSSDELGGGQKASIVIQLTGRSSNLFLLDGRSFVIASLADSEAEGQQAGQQYSPPTTPVVSKRARILNVMPGDQDKGSISSALDRNYQQLEADRRFDARVAEARARIASELRKREMLLEKLGRDLERHGDPERWKRFGDLILANLSSAERNGDRVVVTDLFDPDMCQIGIEIDENDTLTEAAEKYFRRYTKARNAIVGTKNRRETLEREISDLKLKSAAIEEAIATRNDRFFEELLPVKRSGFHRSGKKTADFTGARRFTSSDGFEILVGKKATDNDRLTFRVAGPLDLWLHAADYAGSHVVVRNPNRAEIPRSTLLEAAQLAAFYSSGKKQPKAAVNYTQKKFVNKPRGAKPGLVRLASFKTILVEPKVSEQIKLTN